MMKKGFILITGFLLLAGLMGSVNLIAQEKEQGESIKCAVCDKTLENTTQMVTAEFKGKTYHFCCEKCKAAFDKEPEKYVKHCKTYYACTQCDYKSDKPGKCPHCKVDLKKHEHKTFYVCPMKECNVKSDKPGKCPKCGMELKAVKCEHAADHHSSHKEHTH